MGKQRQRLLHFYAETQLATSQQSHCCSCLVKKKKSMRNVIFDDNLMSESMTSPASSCWLIMWKKSIWTWKSVNLTTGTNNCIQKGSRREELIKFGHIKSFILEQPQPPILSDSVRFITKSSQPDCTPVWFSLLASTELLQVSPWAELAISLIERRWENGVEGR